jgi:hypothetical protein
VAVAEAKVQVLTEQEAAKLLLAAHASCSPARWQQQFTPAQMARHALCIALCTEIDVVSAKQKLLLAVQGTCAAGSTPPVYYRKASGQQPLYFPAKGQDWTLQEVLPLGKVEYLHTAYTDLLLELQQRGQVQHFHLHRLLTTHLDLHMRPIAGSARCGRLSRPATAGGLCCSAWVTSGARMMRVPSSS